MNSDKLSYINGIYTVEDFEFEGEMYNITYTDYTVYCDQDGFELNGEKPDVEIWAEAWDQWLVACPEEAEKVAEAFYEEHYDEFVELHASDVEDHKVSEQIDHYRERNGGY